MGWTLAAALFVLVLVRSRTITRLELALRRADARHAMTMKELRVGRLSSAGAEDGDISGHADPQVTATATVLQAVPAGQWVRLPFQISQVGATGTTATGIVVAEGNI